MITEARTNRAVRRERNWLMLAAGAFMTANFIHTADHVRQGISGVRPTVIVAGTVVTIAAIVAVGLVHKRHPYAAAFAAVVGLQSFVGIGLAHLAPDWGFLSDSYVDDVHADALSWAAMLLEMAAAGFLGVVGWRSLR